MYAQCTGISTIIARVVFCIMSICRGVISIFRRYHFLCFSSSSKCQARFLKACLSESVRGGGSFNWLLLLATGSTGSGSVNKMSYHQHIQHRILSTCFPTRVTNRHSLIHGKEAYHQQYLENNLQFTYFST